MSGYKSDYQKMTEMYSNTKTDGYGGKQNALSNNSGNYRDKHEHAFYNPKTGVSGWHGIDCKTKGNDPKKSDTK